MVPRRSSYVGVGAGVGVGARVRVRVGAEQAQLLQIRAATQGLEIPLELVAPG